jgi:hypothetical protein
MLIRRIVTLSLLPFSFRRSRLLAGENNKRWCAASALRVVDGEDETGGDEEEVGGDFVVIFGGLGS